MSSITQTNSTPGPDGITSEEVAALFDSEITDKLMDILNTRWTNKLTPTEPTKADIVSIYKIGTKMNRASTGQYRYSQ